MRAIVIREAGGLERLELTEVETPTPGPGQVLVKVLGCGVCYRDLLDREGKYPFMRRPIVTGHEFAGEITKIGAAAAGFSVGDRVAATHRPACGACPSCERGEETRCLQSPVSYGLTVDGGYAEYVLAWVGSLVRVPAGVDPADIAFMHCTAGVALRALRTHARLAEGETVVITGATGGVGMHAVQVAKILGARVVAITSNAAKAERLRAIGADEVVVSTGDFHKQVSDADVALELVGAPTFNSALRTLRIGGRLVIVGNVTASRIDVNPGYLILKEISLTGSSGASRADLAEILGWVAAGKLKPVIADKLPLAEARAAQTRLRDKDVVGRIVLVP
jgi:acryloyl-coenzyme A reductase